MDRVQSSRVESACCVNLNRGGEGGCPIKDKGSKQSTRRPYPVSLTPRECNQGEAQAFRSARSRSFREGRTPAIGSSDPSHLFLVHGEVHPIRNQNSTQRLACLHLSDSAKMRSLPAKPPIIYPPLLPGKVGGKDSGCAVHAGALPRHAVWPAIRASRSAARGLALSVAKLAQTCGQQPKTGEPPPDAQPTKSTKTHTHTTNWASNEEAAEENGISFLLPIGSVLSSALRLLWL